MAKSSIPRPRILSVTAAPVKRALAFIIDLLVIDLVLFFPFRIIFTRLVPNPSFSSLNELIGNPEFTSLFMAVAFGMGILAILYFTVLEFRIHQTLGKILLRISVKSDQKELQLWQCLVRSISLLPLFPFIILWIADIIYIFFNQRRQRLLEILSKTATVETIVGA